MMDTTDSAIRPPAPAAPGLGRSGGTGRRPDWPERLASAIAAARHRPFRWGEHDCCLFTADCIAAVTGTDVAADWRGRYADHAGAWRLLSARGFRTLRDLADDVARAHDWPTIAPLLAGRGDVALLCWPIGPPYLGVCAGERFAAVADEGLIWLDRGYAVAAWRIG